ncbi:MULTISPECIES: hypothetical protein [Planktothricoides]|uniref:Uncharacterized protein n=2 Tax=Planktothricoides raciborskii TaxID=132608 RepID=A0AAU8JBL4_9CYAN|nr:MULTISPECIES: hypothetical protein [Planktothricoides]MBD2544875.1 hypothetical protein [Planktothricoides raciborskii FACHB-1370]MBD2583029.1 hypothetical protein [Planktothricoides raciborskii FACHB-1261]
MAVQLVTTTVNWSKALDFCSVSQRNRRNYFRDRLVFYSDDKIFGNIRQITEMIVKVKFGCRLSSDRHEGLEALGGVFNEG